MKNKEFASLLLPQVLIFLVVAMNLQCAFSYIFNPMPYVAPFELSGEPGRVAVIGIGILFVMWQVPYVFALVHPQRNRRSLLEANLMQGIGLAGETLLLRSIPGTHVSLRASILRFVIFDAVGLLLLLIALIYIFRLLKSQTGESHAD
jgi:uncharacterized membrane protein YjfL (UPF0719 family)